MRKRKRYHSKRRPQPQERTYPTPAERERIIQRRDDLTKQLIELFVVESADKHQDEIDRLVREYGHQEVAITLEHLQKGSERPYFGDEAYLYRDYRQMYARFGGERRFLGKPEFEDLTYQNALLVAKREFKSLFRVGPSKREREWSALLLLDERSWSDLFPPAPPPRPPDFAAPPPGRYPPRLQRLLELGWKADENTIAAKVGSPAAWRPFLPDLERMVFDEGLLSGWPAEPPSWAPLHALRLLGLLRAHALAGRLLALMEREDDWLSDLLPSVWGKMGPPAAEPLWAYVRDRQHAPGSRGVAMAGLQELAERERSYRRTVIEGLVRLLDESPVDDARANGYIVHILEEMGAVEALPALHRAEGKVDSRIINLEEAIQELEDMDERRLAK